MNFILIIVTIGLTIMTIQSNRLRFLIKVIFSCITTYLFVKTVNHGNLYFWSDSDFTNENFRTLIDSGIAFQSIIGFCLSYIIFYFFIKLLLRIIVKNTIEKRINEALKKFSNDDKEKVRRGISLIGYRWFKISLYGQISDKDETPRNVNDLFSMMIHFIVCWFILGINTNPLTIALLLIPITLTLLFIIFMPYRKFSIK
jgi:hypothetical protein